LNKYSFPCVYDLMLEASFKSDIFTRRGMRTGVDQEGIVSPVLFSLYVNDMPTSSHHIGLALCAEYTAVRATSRQPALLVSYYHWYVSGLKRWLRQWTIAVNVSKSTAIFFARTDRRIPKPRQVRLFGKPVHCFDTARYLGVTLDTWLTRSTHIDQIRKKAA
jgi:hypothetical protein